MTPRAKMGPKGASDPKLAQSDPETIFFFK